MPDPTTPTYEQIQIAQRDANFSQAMVNLRSLKCWCVLFCPAKGSSGPNVALAPEQKAFLHAELVSLAKLYEPEVAAV